MTSDFHYLYFSIPAISSFIGWLTNYLAVKLLFRPYRERKILFFRIQGIFPKRRAALTDKLAVIISEDLLHKEKLIGQVDVNTRLDDLIIEHIKEYMSDLIQRKVNKIPFLSSLIGGGSLERLEESLLVDFREKLGPMKEKFLHEAINSLDVHKAVKEYLDGLSMEQVEELIRSVLAKEFRFIEVSGAVLGFMIGVGQWAIVWFR